MSKTLIYSTPGAGAFYNLNRNTPPPKLVLTFGYCTPREKSGQTSLDYFVQAFKEATLAGKNIKDLEKDFSTLNILCDLTNIHDKFKAQVQEEFYDDFIVNQQISFELNGHKVSIPTKDLNFTFVVYVLGQNDENVALEQAVTYKPLLDFVKTANLKPMNKLR